MNKLYSSLNSLATNTKKFLAGDNTSGATNVCKLYGSVNGRAKLLKKWYTPEPNWGTLTYVENGTTKTYVIKSENDFNVLRGDGRARNDFDFSDGTHITGDTVVSFTFGRTPNIIGDRFLEFTYIQYISAVPNNVVSIGKFFLANCNFLTGQVEVPSSVVSIGMRFMNLDNNFIGPLVVNTSASPQDVYSLSANVTSVPMYATGVTLRGSGASAWKANLPNSDVAPYRKLVLG